MVGMEGGPGTQKPAQMNFWNVSLQDMIQNAYDVKSFQITGPDWLNSARFDVSARVPAGATKAESRVMLQNLLAERFRLRLHHSTKESSIYGLTIAKSGPKLKDAAPGSTPGRRMVTMVAGGHLKMVLNGATIPQFLDILALQVDRPVIDMTGLTGTYDINMEFAPDMGVMGARMAEGGMMSPPGSNAGDPNAAATLFSALQEQLGLRLEAKKGPVELLIIDSVEKSPTEN